MVEGHIWLGHFYPMPATPVYKQVAAMLSARGWLIDEAAIENASGELREFVHPDTSKHMAWIDALLAEADRENGR